jgi:nucleolar protein 12
VKPPPKTRYDDIPASTRKAPVPVDVDADLEEKDSIADEDDEELSSLDGDLEDANITSAEDDVLSVSSEDNNLSNNPLENYNYVGSQSRKRKLAADEDDLEGKYMLRIAKEEEKEEEARQAERRLKRQKLNARQESGKPGAGDETGEESKSMQEAVHSREAQPNGRFLDIPQHETLARDKDEIELEKSSRTVFLANVSILAITDKKAKKTLLEHMGSFLESLPVQQGKPKHKIESIRFRSTAYAGTSLPKKAAFAKKNLMEATTKGSNAYLVYSTAFAAREAVKKLNGTMVLDRHLRVDGVAHPAKTDHRRCIFVGNLGFVDDESLMDEGGENERKRSKIPSDVEEGLWRQFGKAGTVESVRVVRDEKTRVGKGFAYVQFQVSTFYFATKTFY